MIIVRFAYPTNPKLIYFIYPLRLDSFSQKDYNKHIGKEKPNKTKEIKNV